MLEALIAGGAAVTVALINVLPNLKTSKKLNNLSQDVRDLKHYIIAEKDIEQIRKKFKDVQTYFINKIENDYKAVAIMKSDTFMELVIDFGLTLDLDNLNDYQAFQDHLFSASQYNQQRMQELLGGEMTTKYYTQHRPNMLRYNTVIQKIFMTTENSKKQKFISASIDFMQLFMTEMICLKNGTKKELLAECEQKARRCDDHN